jgi:hypothetical protein
VKKLLKNLIEMSLLKINLTHSLDLVLEEEFSAKSLFSLTL